MKSFIFTIASIVLMINIWFATNSLREYNRRNEQLRFIAVQASVSGALYEDNESDYYQDGIFKFNDEQTLTAIKDIVCINMHLDRNQIPVDGSYWLRPVVITVEIFDDISCREYRNGILTREFPFTYPYLYEDPTNDFSQTVAWPTVCVKIDAGERPIGGGVIRLTPHMVRAGAHEMVGR